MYKHAVWSPLLLASILVAVCGEKLRADPPPQVPLAYNVKYWTHADPNDPNSPVEFEIRLSLANEDSDGDDIGWDITKVRIREYDPNGVLLSTWSENDPNVPTSDGLWWVTHDDPSTPQRDEFVLPPHLVGTATALDQNDADLEYDIAGVELSPPPLYNVVAGLDYEFTVVGESEPTGSGSDEPVEVPIDLTDPGD